MILEGNSDIVKSHEVRKLKDHHIEILHFCDGKVLAVHQSAIALYKNVESIGDPLGNGLIDSAEMPAKYAFNLEKVPWVISYNAGHVGLDDGKAIAILPKNIKLYPSNQDALKNRDAIAVLSFT